MDNKSQFSPSLLPVLESSNPNDWTSELSDNFSPKNVRNLCPTEFILNELMKVLVVLIKRVSGKFPSSGIGIMITINLVHRVNAKFS